jgi:hypothetical protein
MPPYPEGLMMPSVIPSPENTEEYFMPSTGEELNNALTHAQKHKTLPQYLKTKDARRAFQSAFELIGGIPRLALWANENPDKFFPIYARFLDNPTNAQQPTITLNLNWMKGRDLSGDTVTDVEVTGE